MKSYKFLKDHIDYKKGSIHELEDGHGNYLVRVQAAIELKVESPSGKKANDKKKANDIP